MYRLITCQTSSRKVMVILPLRDLYDYEIEVASTSELTPASEGEMIEDIPAEQTYATVHAEVNGLTELELSEMMTN